MITFTAKYNHKKCMILGQRFLISLRVYFYFNYIYVVKS